MNIYFICKEATCEGNPSENYAATVARATDILSAMVAYTTKIPSRT
jgi:hypothetical protein